MSSSLRTENKRRRTRLARAVSRLVQVPRILTYRLLSTCAMEGRPVLRQPLHLQGAGRVSFEGKVQVGFFPSPYHFSTHAYIEARRSTARVSVGDGCLLNNGFCAIAEHTSITLGRRVLVGTNVEIYDSDFHGLRLSERSCSDPAQAARVVIEDDVFLGSNVRVLKGVTIGRGTVVANSSVVASDLPPGVVAAGVPARAIRSIE